MSFGIPVRNGLGIGLVSTASLVAKKSIGVLSNWILAASIWSDVGVWNDAATWNG